MLKGMRKNTKIIIWTVVVSFVLWGGFSVSTQFTNEGRIAGKVFGKPISFQEYDRFHQASQIFTFGREPTRDPAILRNMAWQSLIYSHEAKNQKIKVSDDEVRTELMRILEQSNLPNPTNAQYEAWLSANFRQTPQQFESQIREMIRMQKLIRKVNQGPFDGVTEELAKTKYLLDQNKLSAQLVKFKAQEEAETFGEKVQNSKNWDKVIKNDSLKTEIIELLSLEGWMKSHNVQETDFYSLQSLELEAISAPIEVGKEFVVFKVLEKEVADDEKFESEFKEQYLKEIEDQVRYQNFVSWNIDLQDRAGLEDFLPKVEPLPQAPVAPEAPTTPQE